MAHSERAALWVATALGIAGFAACGFPSHKFIPDNQFDDASVTTGGTSGGGGSGGTVGGSGGTLGGSGGTSGTAGVGGSSGSGTGGSGVGGACGTNGECVSAPSGFKGPVAVWMGTTSDTAPGCSQSSGYPNQVLNLEANLNTPAASCPSCSCDAPTGETCPTVVNLSYYSDTQCQGAYYWGPLPVDSSNSCSGFELGRGPGGEQPQSAVFDDIPTGGSCTSHSSGQANIPKATWTNQARVCGGASTIGCGSGSVCAPVPAQSFKLCVYQSGNVACPQPFSEQHTYYSGVTDTRACSQCDCGAPAGASCSGTIADSTGATCGVGTTTNIPAGTCTAVAKDSTPGTLDGGLADTRVVAYTPGTASGGNCPVIAAKVTGSLTKTGQYTVCCIP